MGQALEKLTSRIRQLANRAARTPGAKPRKSVAGALGRYAPEPYLARVVVVALLGYAWLLAFPIVAGCLLIDLPHTIMLASRSQSWVAAGVETAAFLLCVWITALLLRLKVDNGQTAGVEVRQSENPALFDQLAALYAGLGAKPAHRVILTGEMAVAMDHVPVNGFPFVLRRHLHIGLPLLVALSPEHAKGALARAIGQSSLRHNRVTGWLRGLYAAWLHYQTVYRLQPKKVRWPLQICFLGYARWFTTIARHALRADELAGDQYALDTINDSDVVELISALTVYPRLLLERFWPPFRRLACKYPTPPMAPHARLVQALPALLRRAETTRWLADALRRGGNGTTPALAERLDNIGHRDAKLPVPPNAIGNAAAELLGDTMSELRARLDEAWLRDNAGEWQQRHAKYQKEMKLLKTLDARARIGAIEPREAWTRARLVAKHRDKAAAVPLFKNLVAEYPDDARRLLEAGRLLLGCGEPAGVAALEQAMELDRRCCDQAVRIIAAYRAAQGRKADAA